MPKELTDRGLKAAEAEGRQDRIEDLDLGDWGKQVER